MRPNTIITICRGIILDRQVRRKVMTGSIVVAAALLFFLMVLSGQFWRDHPWIFIFTLFACGWMTILSALLALYDMLLVRAHSRRQRKRLESDFLDENKRDD